MLLLLLVELYGNATLLNIIKVLGSAYFIIYIALLPPYMPFINADTLLWLWLWLCVLLAMMK